MILLVLAFVHHLNAQVHPQVCSQLFSKNIRHDEGMIAKQISDYYLFSRRHFLPTQGISDLSVKGYNVVEKFYIKNLDYVVVVSSFKQMLKPKLRRLPIHGPIQTPTMDIHSPSFFDKYLSEVESNIDFVLSAYERRRDWSSEFRKSLRQQALRDADRSTYLVVKGDFKENFESIWGTLKVVRSRAIESSELLLPMEEALDIRLPFNGGFKFEPSNFVIDKTHYKEAMAQVLLHLSRWVRIELANHPQIDPNKKLFYTYADRESKRMYQSLGFSPTQGFESPLFKEGKHWWVLSISGKDLAELPLKIKERRLAWSDKDQELFQEVVALFDFLQEDAFVEHSLFTKNIVLKHDKSPTEVIFTRSEPHIYRGQMVTKLGIQFDGFSEDGICNLPIPLSRTPLQDGLRFHLQEQSDAKYGTITYNRGVFVFDYHFFDEHTHFELMIDPELTHPQHLIFEITENNVKRISFEADFPHLD